MASSYSIEYKLLRFALPLILITCNLIDYQAPNIVVKWECRLRSEQEITKVKQLCTILPSQVIQSALKSSQGWAQYLSVLMKKEIMSFMSLYQDTGWIRSMISSIAWDFFPGAWLQWITQKEKHLWIYSGTDSVRVRMSIDFIDNLFG